MNKFALLLLSSSFALSLAACDSSDDDAETQATTATDGSSDTDSGTPSGTGTSGPSGTTDPSDSGTTDPSDSGTTDPTGGGGAACVYQCASDEDCTIDGTDLGLTCTGNSICLNVCETDDDCVAQLSGWSFQPCDSNDTCLSGPCVDLGDGAGGCATEPTEFVDCAALMQAEVEVQDIDGATVTVCGNDSGTCGDIGNGDRTCTIDAKPTSCEETGCGDGFTCDASDGVCRCDNDDACAAFGEGFTCGDDGACTAPGCTDSSECDGELPYDGGSFECI